MSGGVRRNVPAGIPANRRWCPAQGGASDPERVCSHAAWVRPQAVRRAGDRPAGHNPDGSAGSRPPFAAISNGDWEPHLTGVFRPPVRPGEH